MTPSMTPSSQYAYFLFHNLYFAKLKKCLNLYCGHRLSSSGFDLNKQFNLSRKDNDVHYLSHFPSN